MNRGDRIRYKDNKQLAEWIYKVTCRNMDFNFCGQVECIKSHDEDLDDIDESDCIDCLKEYLDGDGDI